MLAEGPQAQAGCFLVDRHSNQDRHRGLLEVVLLRRGGDQECHHSNSRAGCSHLSPKPLSQSAIGTTCASSCPRAKHGSRGFLERELEVHLRVRMPHKRGDFSLAREGVQLAEGLRRDLSTVLRPGTTQRKDCLSLGITLGNPPAKRHGASPSGKHLLRERLPHLSDDPCQSAVGLGPQMGARAVQKNAGDPPAQSAKALQVAELGQQSVNPPQEDGLRLNDELQLSDGILRSATSQSLGALGQSGPRRHEQWDLRDLPVILIQGRRQCFRNGGITQFRMGHKRRCSLWQIQMHYRGPCTVSVFKDLAL